MREITLSQAVNEALAEEMRRDETVFIIGEDVAEAGTPFKVLSGLVEEFGTARVIDTPIAEPGFMGIAVGAAMTGSRPVVDLMFGDFIFLIMDQLCNQAAKTHYMSGGKLNVPLVLRTNLGATRRSAAQHSQSLHALVAHIPGPEGRPAVISLRGQGADEDGDPRQQSGGHLRRQADVPGQGRRPGRGIPDPLRRRQCKARRLRHYPDRHVFDGAGLPKRRPKFLPRRASAPK
jgi:hypothetical protein